MSITAAEIKKVVLTEDDFGHEMRVGDIFACVKYPDIQFDVTIIERPNHGGTYKDAVTQKTRQFDYRCEIYKGRNRESRIFLAVECKNINKDLPLVVCGRPRTIDESYHEYFMKDAGRIKLLRVDGLNTIYKEDEFVGKSLFRLKKKQGVLCSDGDSEIYDKWSQALASCYDLAVEASRNPIALKIQTFLMPIVVVPNDSLWVANYSNDGSLSKDPEQVDQCSYFVDQKLSIPLALDYSIPEFPLKLTHIHFVTLKGLAEMLGTFVAQRSRIWDAIFSTASTELFRS